MKCTHPKGHRFDVGSVGAEANGASVGRTVNVLTCNRRGCREIQWTGCGVMRTKTIRHLTMTWGGGIDEGSGREEIVTELCGTPLFDENDRVRGVCGGCHSGWEVGGNRFANETERVRAATDEGMRLGLLVP